MKIRLLLCPVAALTLGACTSSDQPAAPVIAPTEVAAVQTPPPDYPAELGCTGVGGTSTSSTRDFA